ncbi:hypothetical protein AB2M62_01830 [Sphingomonas sp. MMS12-HWE2-04]|uniref:hypothetical protein n=1 Tax=Sphingomonas sp. MMS12-HWE2-04 TaxID=3234199 RepID=UPI00384AE8DD
MPTKQEVASFVRSSFRSVWSLELLCFLRKNRDQAFGHADLVAALRGSDLVVTHSVEGLLAAGLVVIEGENRVRYQPVSDPVDKLAGAAEALYAQRPDSVRRIIVTPSGAASFADAFRLRRD